ncbi:hypothetical protein [Nesterenkonia rhizosphaerae]|uniref:Uncharacterized protein n=1 Tax=Nesterenkonia rhizosphaerae TaxID=1348272 RepID=A0ABP9FT70_9MICC
MDWNLIWPAVASVFGAGGFAVVGLQEFRKWRSGRAQQERERNNTLKRRTDLAEAERRYHYDLREWEATYRRRVQEFASRLIGMLAERQVPQEAMPPYPEPPSGKPAWRDYDPREEAAD